MLINLCAYFIALNVSCGSLPRDTTVIGKALKDKGAIVVTSNKRCYWLAGFGGWSKKFYGKTVKVTGTLEVQHTTKAVNEAGEEIQAILGDKYIIRNAKWVLIK